MPPLWGRFWGHCDRKLFWMPPNAFEQHKDSKPETEGKALQGFRFRWPVIRFYPRGVQGFAHATPRFLKSKFDELDLEVHPDFYTQLEKRLAASSRGHAKPAQTEMTSQERQSALKLIAAMSCEQYGFNPKANRNDSTKRIQEDLASVGLSLDNKTILKWLKDAADLIDKDYWSED